MAADTAIVTVEGVMSRHVARSELTAVIDNAYSDFRQWNDVTAERGPKADNTIV